MATIAKLEAKADRCIGSGDFYEAHQVYRTIHNRLKGDPSQNAALLSILLNGSLKLIAAGEFGSGLDLCELYADQLKAGSVPASAEQLENVEKLVASIPARFGSGNSDATENGSQSTAVLDRRANLISKLVEWSSFVSTGRQEKKSGARGLHALLARVLWKEGHLLSAKPHFFLADIAEEFAAFLVDAQHRGGHPDEVDLFVAQATFQLLVLRKLGQARQLFRTYCQRHPSIGRPEPPFPSPLLNFTWCIVDAAPAGQIPVLSELCDRYSDQFYRDSSYRGLIDQIAQIYFDAPPPRAPGSNNLIGNLLKNLMGGPPGASGQQSAQKADDENGFSSEDEREIRTARAAASSSARRVAPSSSTSAAMDVDGYVTADEEEQPKTTALAKTKPPPTDDLDLD